MQITEKARPTYSAEPKDMATWPLSLKHSCVAPMKPCTGANDSVFSAQKTPPPTYLMPEPIRPPPMSMMAAPVTTGGKSFLRMRGGMNETRISTSDATRHVPRKRP